MTIYPLTDDAARALRRAAAQYDATTQEDRWDRWERAASDLEVARLAIERQQQEDAA